MSDNRFMRTQMLLGQDGMSKLQSSKVMIIGLGAVGGYVAEALARAGVGKFVLVDFDVFEKSNINRQILATEESLGQKKVIVAKQRILSINPAAEILIKDIFVNTEAIPELLASSPDFVVDAIDSLNPKCNLIQSLLSAGTPFISSMGAALKTDPSKIKIGKLSQSKNCSLAKFVRKRLRKRGVDISKAHCIWSDEQTELPETALSGNDTFSTSNGRARNTLGSLPTITAIFGLVIANEVILKLSGFRNQNF